MGPAACKLCYRLLSVRGCGAVLVFFLLHRLLRLLEACGYGDTGRVVGESALTLARAMDQASAC